MSPVRYQPSASNTRGGERGIGVAERRGRGRATRSRRRVPVATGAPSSSTQPDLDAGHRRPSVPCRFSAGSSNEQPVIDGCSVEPYARTSVMPCDAARSASASGHRRAAQADALDPPRVLGREAGMVEEAGEEHRRTGSGADVGLEHDVEDARRVPAVDQVDVLAQLHRREHRAEHAGRVRHRRTHEVRRAGRDPRPRCASARRATCGGCASRPWVRSSCPTCTRARRRRRARTSRSPARRRRAASTTSHAHTPHAWVSVAPTSPTTTCRSSSGSSPRVRAVDDVEIVDVPVAVGRDVRARPALCEDEAHFLGAVDVHDRHEHVAAHREPVERDDRLPPVRQLERDDVARDESPPSASAVTSRRASAWMSA